MGQRPMQLASLDDEFILGVPLHIKQRRQVAKVDPHVTFRRHGGLGVQRHAHARARQHAQIVCPVAHGNHVVL